MIPKIAACVHAVEHGVGSAHILDGRLPHVLLLELFSDAGIGTMITERPRTLRRAHLMPNYAPPPVTFVRGQGTELWDGDGKRYLDCLSGLAVTSLGHSHPAVAEALSRAGHDAAARLEPVRQRPQRRQSPRTLDTPRRRRHPAGGQVFFCNSGAEANECAIKLARKFGGRGGHVVVSAYGTLPRPHARHAPRHRPTGQARGVPALPEGFRHVVWEDARRARARARPSVAAVLLEPVQGEGGVNPASARVLPGRPAALRPSGASC